jgi:hypothetical protein
MTPAVNDPQKPTSAPVDNPPPPETDPIIPSETSDPVLPSETPDPILPSENDAPEPSVPIPTKVSESPSTPEPSPSPPAPATVPTVRPEPQPAAPVEPARAAVPSPEPDPILSDLVTDSTTSLAFEEACLGVHTKDDGSMHAVVCPKNDGVCPVSFDSSKCVVLKPIAGSLMKGASLLKF